MKLYCAIATVLLEIVSLTADAQTGHLFSKSAYIEPYKLEVTYNKTTNLVFPSAITNIDRGSQDILAQKANGAENILRVKADVKDFAETSLSVITTDGKLYSFLVSYANLPGYLNINVGNAAQPVVPTGKVDYLAYANQAALLKRNIHSIEDESMQMAASLRGLYIKENALFFRLQFRNQSRLNYDIDQFRFYIRDKKKVKRTAIQETEIQPLFISGDTSVVKGRSTVKWIVAIPKLTIPDGKYMVIQIMEKNGGRHLKLKVKNRDIVKARGL
ncbi:MAG: conjugative transposon protein TraN [Bacteroidota bacterium]